MPIKRIAALLLVLVPGLAIAQLPTSVSGPVLGYVFSGDEGTLRPLLGIVGSSRIGKPLDFGFTIARAEVLPDQRHALAAPVEGPDVLVIDLEASPVSSRSVTVATAGLSRIASSPRGSAAAFYYASSGKVSIVAGLPLNPVVSQSIDVSLLGRSLGSIAVNDEGTLLLFSLTGAGEDLLYAWTDESPLRVLAASPRIGAITFLGSKDAVFADRDSNEVFLIQDVRRVGARLFLAGPREGVSRPVGVAVSSRNEIYVANESGEVMVLNASGHMLRRRQCNCEITAMNPLRDSVFQMTTRLDKPVYLMDTGSIEDRIYFVPALH